jgi:hypothetical protein
MEMVDFISERAVPDGDVRGVSNPLRDYHRDAEHGQGFRWLAQLWVMLYPI